MHDRQADRIGDFNLIEWNGPVVGPKTEQLLAQEVRDMLDLYDLGDGQRTQLEVALTRFEEKIAELEARRRDIDRAHAELTHARDVVRARLARRGG